MVTPDDIAVFSLRSGEDLARRVCDQLGCELAPHEERSFDDGEHKTRPLASVRGKDVFVVQSVHGDHDTSVNDKLCRLLFFLGALRDASAGRVTAVVPYLCYARKDRKSKPRDPVTTRYVAALFEAVGVDRVVTVDVHNLAAFQNAFRIHTDHLEARALLATHFAPILRETGVAVVSPDVGGVKRAEAFRHTLEQTVACPVSSAFMEKHRSEGIVTGDALVGDVRDRVALLIDDLVASGTTLRRAAEACRASGATRVFAAATHGVFTPGASAALARAPIEQLVILDTVPPARLAPSVAPDRLVVLDAAPLLAEAVRRIHEGGSIVDLVGD